MFLDVLGALYGHPDGVLSDLGLGALRLIWTQRGPHHNHGVTHKLDDVATTLVQVRNHALHISIDTESQLLITFLALLGACLRQISEATDVSEHADGLHGLQLGQYLPLWLLPIVLVRTGYQSLQHQRGYILIEG